MNHKVWEYTHVSYNRNHKNHEPSIYAVGSPLNSLSEGDRLYLSTFLREAGKQGWELVSTLLPFPKGKELVTELANGKEETYSVGDPLDIQWLIFKREKL